jgi:hypothetical protein
MQPRAAPGPNIQANSIPNGYTPQQHTALARDAEGATRSQLICALDYIVNLFKVNQIAYAVMGGLALNLRGSDRDTNDVDISTSCDMATLRDICKGQPRYVVCIPRDYGPVLFYYYHKLTISFSLRMPLGPTAGVMRVFVEVGPKHNENVGQACVQVDIILLGK